MLDIDIITLFPEMFKAMDYGINGRAIKNKLIQLNYWNPRDLTIDKHRTVDDTPYGGGPGMVMKAEPLIATIEQIKQKSPDTTVIYVTPQGKQLDQQGVDALLLRPRLTFLAGRYEGIDERVVASHVDEEISIGDYVLSGGELAIMVIIDTMTRLLPGALGDEQSAQQDSFMHGLLDYPHYTRPETVAGMKVPHVLLQGNHQAIADWRLQQALARTWQRRPDLLAQRQLTDHEKQLLNDFIEEHNLGGVNNE